MSTQASQRSPFGQQVCATGPARYQARGIKPASQQARVNRHPPQQAPKLSWEQWGGIVERGYPDTLVLKRLQPKKTKMSAPGPGAIRKRDWAPIANKHLKGRRVFLHTDGARA